MILRDHEPSTGLENVVIDGIKVGKMYFTYEALAQNVNNVPYLMHIIGNAKHLFDREDSIKPLLEKINNYFAQNPKMAEEWNRYYRQFRAEKKQFGCEKTTVINVSNELESRYSEGEIKRTFFS